MTGAAQAAEAEEPSADVDVDGEVDGAIVDRLEENPLVFAVRSTTNRTYAVVCKGRHFLRCLLCSCRTCEHTAALASVARRDGFYESLVPATGGDGTSDAGAASISVSRLDIRFPIRGVSNAETLPDCLFAAVDSGVCIHGNKWSDDEIMPVRGGALICSSKVCACYLRFKSKVFG